MKSKRRQYASSCEGFRNASEPQEEEFVGGSGNVQDGYTWVDWTQFSYKVEQLRGSVDVGVSLSATRSMMLPLFFVQRVNHWLQNSTQLCWRLAQIWGTQCLLGTRF